MTETEQNSTRNWQSVRTVLEGLILLGIVWLASSIQDQAKATIALQTQMTNVAADIASLRGQLADVPALSRQLTRVETTQAELMRRQAIDEARWEKLDNSKLKGWAR